MTHRHLAALTYDVRCLNHAAHVILSSEMMIRQLDGGESSRIPAEWPASTGACSTR